MIKYEEVVKMLKISLKAARVNAGFSQREVADKLKVSNKTICKWENGETFPSVEKITLLCELYGVPYDNINFYPTIRFKRIYA